MELNHSFKGHPAGTPAALRYNGSGAKAAKLIIERKSGPADIVHICNPVFTMEDGDGKQTISIEGFMREGEAFSEGFRRVEVCLTVPIPLKTPPVESRPSDDEAQAECGMIQFMRRTIGKEGSYEFHFDSKRYDFGPEMAVPDKFIDRYNVQWSLAPGLYALCVGASSLLEGGELRNYTVMVEVHEERGA